MIVSGSLRAWQDEPTAGQLVVALRPIRGTASIHGC